MFKMAKRSLSDSEFEDNFSDTKESCMTPSGENTGCVSRKKRRGIIEKRRRDRINNSLTELRRLVPTCFEKSSSAKLEKAEILQMTVEHLKILHAKGLDALSYDPHKFAIDYHSIGFRECASEVARYMVTVEGMDIQDPLRMRLMSHLQCFAAQRELANKQSATSWGISPLTSNTYSIQTHHHSSTGGLHTATALQPTQHQTHMETSPNNSHMQNSYNTNQISPNMPNDVNGQQQLHMSSQQTQRQHTAPPPYHHHQNNLTSPDPSHMSPSTYLQGGGMMQHQLYSQGGKGPYRPWGAEIAY